MAFCSNCGTQVEDGVRFCPSCGNTMGTSGAQAPSEAAQPAADPRDFSDKIAALNNTADTTAEFTKADIDQNKAMAILAYFGPLVLIPLLAAKNSKYARYHSNQGLILLISAIVYSIAYSILSVIVYAISWRLGFIVSILSIVGIVFTILAIIGIVNAATGRAKELPIIGKFRILK